MRRLEDQRSDTIGQPVEPTEFCGGTISQRIDGVGVSGIKRGARQAQFGREGAEPCGIPSRQKYLRS
jgi:hypothetical protein